MSDSDHVATNQPSKLRVFISYSRRDMAFVDRLQAALGDHGIEASVDREAIEKGEEWWARIEQLITEADTVIFVLSPDSAASPICGNEVDFAEKLNKRFIPVVARDVAGTAPPPALARLNYVFFIANPTAGASGNFDTALNDLVRTLETDIGWIREHTRLGTLAERWQARNRSSELLLRGAELSAAETWIASRPAKAPDPTDAHLAFVTESRKGATRRQRTMVGLSLAAVVVALGLAGLAYWQREVAVKNEALAVQTRDAALASQSRFLAERSREYVTQGNDTVAMLTALEGLPDLAKRPDGSELSNRPYVPEAEAALLQGFAGIREVARLHGHTDAVRKAAFSPNGRHVATASYDSTIRVWDISSGTQVSQLKGHTHWVFRAVFSSDGKRLLTASTAGEVILWDAEDWRRITSFKFHHEPRKVEFTPNGASFLIVHGDTRIYDSRSGDSIAELKAHNQVTADATFSPSGDLIAISGGDGTVQIWDAISLKRLRILRGHKAEVWTVRFSSNSKYLVSASEDQTARLWDIRSGTEILTIDGHSGPVEAAFFHPGFDREFDPLSSTLPYLPPFPPNSFVVTIASRNDGTARIWDLTSARSGKLTKPEHIISHGPYTTIADAEFSPDGGRLLTASRSDHDARLWDVHTGKQIDVLKSHQDGIASAAFSNDGQYIITTSLDHTGRLWRLENKLAEKRYDSEALPSFLFGRNGTRLLTWGNGPSGYLLDTDTGVEIAQLVGHSSAIVSASFSKDGEFIATTAADRTARVWRASDGKLVSVLSGHSDTVWAASFQPGSDKVATASADGTIKFWNVQNGSQILDLRTKSASSNKVSISPDGSRIVSATSDGSAVSLWSVSTGELIATEKAVESLWSPKFGPTGHRLLIEIGQGRVQLRDATDGHLVKELSGHCSEQGDLTFGKCSIFDAAFSPDGKLLITSGEDGEARIWDAVTGDELAVLRGHEGWVRRSGFSPSGRHVVTISEGKVRLWHVEDPMRIKTVLRHRKAVRTFSFNRQGTRLLTASEDGMLRVWHIGSGLQLAFLSNNTGFLDKAEFSFNGNRIAASSNSESTLRLWELPGTTQEAVDSAKHSVTRCLTQSERNKNNLSAEPPRWCITGPGLEAEIDPASWRPRWPYDTEAWRDWLIARDEGEEPPLPQSPSSE